MFKRLLGLGSRANREVTDAIYGQIVAAARQPHLFLHWSVPDTPLGRFEMIALHMFLFLHRIRGEDAAVAELGQDVTDTFFTEVDHSLRELGIGDASVPKRMKRLARMYYGRFESYGAAMDANDRSALAAAIARNVRPGEEDWPEAGALADYAVRAGAVLAGQQAADFLGGSIRFPEPAETEERS